MLRHDGQSFGFCISAEDIRRAVEPLDETTLTASK